MDCTLYRGRIYQLSVLLIYYELCIRFFFIAVKAHLKLCHFLKIPILYYPWSVGYTALSSDGAARPKILQMIFQEYDVSMRWVTFIRPKIGFMKKGYSDFSPERISPHCEFSVLKRNKFLGGTAHNRRRKWPHQLL